MWAALFLLALGSLLTVALRVAGQVTDNAEIGKEISEPYVSPTDDLGSWIWTNRTFDGQACLLWRSFEIPAGSTITNAQLVMTADNEFTLFLDGRELGRGAEWRELFVYDLTPLMYPGRHELAVRAFNSFGVAGMILGLRIDLADGRVINVKSDESWRIAPADTGHWETKTEAPNSWPAATVIGPLGTLPWWTQPVNVNKMPSFLPIKVHFWEAQWFQIMLLFVCGCVIVISLRLMAQLALHQKDRLLLQQERARIAREIHDDIGARMTLLVLHGEEAQSGLPERSETSLQLVQICEEARSLLSTMDEILWAVNPRRDTLRDFAAYVCNYTQEFLKPTQIQCLFELDPEMSVTAFNLPLRRSLLLAVKETLNNVVKHSAATEIWLQIRWQSQHLVVVVADNGRGFDAATLKTERNGLTNMTQRMQELGGSCLITSEPGQGCRVEFKVPLKHPRKPLWTWLWKPKEGSEQMNQSRNVLINEHAQNHDPTKC